MPGVNCKCGNIIKIGEIPNPNEWLYISDVDFDSYSGKINSEILYKDFKSFLKCDKCRRLWFFIDGFGSSPISYTLEEN